MRGRWHLLRVHWRTVVVYGLVAVAAPQFFYFSAIAHMEVAPALLIEFTAPAAVVVWLWLRHGERPGRLTLVGAGVAALGLVLVLDLLSGADLSVPGVLWALAAMVGCATYFVMSADEDNGLPPLALATGGLVVGALALAALGPWECSRWRRPPPRSSWPAPLSRGGCRSACWAWSPPPSPTSPASPAIRRLGSRLASFVALARWSSGCCGPGCCSTSCRAPVQLLGGVLILAGVVAVKLGERDTARVEPDD